MGGGDFGVLGFVAAFDSRNGKALWRFNTIPRPGEAGNETWAGDSWKTGGAGVWNSGAYDPEANLVYFGTGNPAPDGMAEPASATTSTATASSRSTRTPAALKWHYQFTPHDELDYDSTQVPVLADIEWQGRPRKAMLWANRNGLAYVLDRITGEFLLGKPFVKVNWTNGFDKKGRPVRVPGKVPTPEGSYITPTFRGATNWAAPSYSPTTGLFYVPAWENTALIAIEGQAPRIPGVDGTGSVPQGQVSLTPNTKKEDEGFG